MNECSSNHPGDESLRALSLGQLAEPELTQVAAHLGYCPACCRRIDELATDDRLLALELEPGALDGARGLIGAAGEVAPKPDLNALVAAVDDGHRDVMPRAA